MWKSLVPTKVRVFNWLLALSKLDPRDMMKGGSLIFIFLPDGVFFVGEMTR